MNMEISIQLFRIFRRELKSEPNRCRIFRLFKLNLFKLKFVFESSSLSTVMNVYENQEYEIIFVIRHRFLQMGKKQQKDTENAMQIVRLDL